MILFKMKNINSDKNVIKININTRHCDCIIKGSLVIFLYFFDIIFIYRFIYDQENAFIYKMGKNTRNSL